MVEFVHTTLSAYVHQCPFCVGCIIITAEPEAQLHGARELPRPTWHSIDEETETLARHFDARFIVIVSTGAWNKVAELTWQHVAEYERC